MRAAPVSVIMPAYNNATTIGRALASIAAQTVVPAQVVVVDDGSADDSHGQAEAWRGRLNGAELILLRQSNQGAGAARNAALVAATETFVAFLDADDEWLPSKLERSLQHLAEGMLFVCHDMVVVADADCEVVFDCTRHFRAAMDPFRALMLRGFVATSTVVALRAAVLSAGGFESSLRAAQDYDLWLTLAERGRFMVFGEALTRYHVNADGITANVARRRFCSLAVLFRHMTALAGHGGWLVVMTRALIIQYEAAAAWRKQGRHAAALIEVVRTLAVVTICLFKYLKRAGER